MIQGFLFFSKGSVRAGALLALKVVLFVKRGLKGIYKTMGLSKG